MPYPVPPPSVPPVINLLPEDSHTVDSAAIAAPTSASVPEFANSSVATAWVPSPIQSDAEPLAGELSAEPLGLPVEVGIDSLSNSLSNSASASVLPAAEQVPTPEPLFGYLPEAEFVEQAPTHPLFAPPVGLTALEAGQFSTIPATAVPEFADFAAQVASSPATGFSVTQQTPGSSSDSSSSDGSSSDGSSSDGSSSDPTSTTEPNSTRSDSTPNSDVLVIPPPQEPVPEQPLPEASGSDQGQSDPNGADPNGSGSSPVGPGQSNQSPEATPAPGSESVPSTPDSPPAGGTRPRPNVTPPVDTTTTQEIIELNADRQEYDEQNRVFRAQGNVELRFRGAVLTSDRLQVNIPNRIAVADGNATLVRGQQVLRGNRIEYNLVQNQGNVQQAAGELALSALTTDLATTPPAANGAAAPPSLNEVLSSDQPFQVLGSTTGIGFGVNTPNQSGSAGSSGQINRLRYEADTINFAGQSWEATNVRITNDPFSPPELELRSNRVTVTPISPTQTEIRARNPRLVFDQGFSLPLLRDRVVIDSRRREPGLVSFGFDERDRGGFFIERPFEYGIGNVALLTLTPQILVQRAIDEEGFGDLSSYGLIARFNVQPSPFASFTANGVFTSLDPSDFESTFRGNVSARYILARHTFALDYSYRNRLYNGSLGFQDVRSSFGLVVTSPTYTLGASQVTLNYQAGVQLINSEVNNERLNDPEEFPEIEDLLEPVDPVTGARPNNRIQLGRYQAAVSLNRFFFAWVGTPLPATAEEGLRYSPNPVVPYVAFTLGGRGRFSAYSNGDFQSVLSGTAGLIAQFGRFSKPVFDFTGLSVFYTYNEVLGETPFDFDRVNDVQVLDVALTQQIYGPLRAGFRSSFYLESLDENRDDTSDTSVFLEYSRRTYAITLSYSPNREAGAINFRINDFNWVGTPDPFSGLESDSEPGT